MIELKNLSKSYIKGIKAIDNINLKINDGEIFGFLGPNGAGKTTTIKMLTGILPIDEGDILIDNLSISKNAIEAKRKFGYVPDEPNMFLQLKGIDYLNFMADVYQVDKEKRRKEIESLSKLFEIDGVLQDKIESYSHGMRQKIIIIGSLLHNPQNWIIDEPMTGLDPKATFELKKIMRKRTQENKTVFFSTHILDVAERICDRIGIINKGKLIYIGTIEGMREELKQNKTLEELYMEITKNDGKY